MAEQIGSAGNPLRVAVVGSGPAGFYAAEELLRQEQPQVCVDMFDRLPTPYGLVRGGVAPDHQKIKSVIKLYERTAARPRFRFFGNVTFGSDVTREDLLAHYHQVLFCTGCETDNRMGIPGEELPGSYPATIFVGWYNAHPDYRDLSFALDQVQSVAVIGNGNVAMDVTRILARSIAELEVTDIAGYALDALKRSTVKTIYLLGRRGPAQAAFTNPEIRELCSMEVADLVVHPPDLSLDPISQEFLDGAKDPVHKRNVEILTGQIAAGEGDKEKKIRARFFVSPTEILGTQRVEGIRIEKNELVKDDKGTVRARGTGETEVLPVQMVFRSIGYRGSALPGMPFDEKAGIIANADGRVLEPGAGQPIPRLYVAGWIKRGPSGVIGTNKPDSIATVRRMLDDVTALASGRDIEGSPDTLPKLLAKRGVRYVSFNDWKRLDALEMAAGKKQGKPRDKFSTVGDMLAALGG
ncbi:MAG: FAD-dependent oxidoreductase [Candidatus Lambdaproteobacteria bacterium]|nr:FAD-dependent oxidoreductase [Candidatus Lambdaproteobacteria bacterium]